MCRATLKRLMVNHRLRHCFFFFFLAFIFLTKTSFVTALCCWLRSQEKHIPCSRTTLDIPVGFFKGFLFLCGPLCFWFIYRVLTAKIHIRNSKCWDRGLCTSSLFCTSPGPGPPLEHQGDLCCLLAVVNEITAWKCNKIFVRDTHWSQCCAKWILSN